MSSSIFQDFISSCRRDRRKQKTRALSRPQQYLCRVYLLVEFFFTFILHAQFRLHLLCEEKIEGKYFTCDMLFCCNPIFNFDENVDLGYYILTCQKYIIGL